MVIPAQYHKTLCSSLDRALLGAKVWVRTQPVSLSSLAHPLPTQPVPDLLNS